MTSLNYKIKVDGLGILSIVNGLNKTQINELIHYSNTDETVKKYSSDQLRFKNKESYNRWFQKNPFIYSVIDSKNKLLGIAWFRESPFPKTKLKREFEHLNTKNYGITFALRIYDKARGKGIAKKVLLAVIQDYLKSKNYLSIKNNNIWIQTSAANIPAIKTYKHFFTQISNSNSRGKVAMVLMPTFVH